MMGGRRRRVSFRQRSSRPRSFSCTKNHNHQQATLTNDLCTASAGIQWDRKTLLGFFSNEKAALTKHVTQRHFDWLRANLVQVERRQAVPAHGLLLGVAAILQGFVPGQEEAHPGAGGGGGVLAGQEEANQHPGNLIVVERSAISGGIKINEMKMVHSYTLEQRSVFLM